MSAFIIFNDNITDRRQIDKLPHLSLSVDEKYSTKVVVGGPVKTLAFSSFQTAQAYYYFDENNTLAKLTNQITEGWFSIVPSVSEKQSLIDSDYFNSQPSN